MDTLALLLLTACGCARSEHLSAAIKRRSDAMPVYASDYAREYRPVMFVAIPLHKPLPVLHVLSPSPLLDGKINKKRSPDQSPQGYYVQSQQYGNRVQPRHRSPYVNSQQYGNNLQVQQHEPQKSYGSQVYASSATHAWYANPGGPEPSPPVKPMLLLSDPSNEEPIVLYAKPNNLGGFTYRKKPTKNKNGPKKNEPIVIKIHKYRVVRER